MLPGSFRLEEGGGGRRGREEGKEGDRREERQNGVEM